MPATCCFSPFPLWPARPSSEYYELIRLPISRWTFFFVVAMSYHAMFCMENMGSPKFLLSLFIHAMFYNPVSLSTPCQSGASVLTSTTLNVLSTAYRNFGAECTPGVTVSLWPERFPVYTSCVSFGACSTVWSVWKLLLWHYPSVAPASSGQMDTSCSHARLGNGEWLTLTVYRLLTNLNQITSLFVNHYIRDVKLCLAYQRLAKVCCNCLQFNTL